MSTNNIFGKAQEFIIANEISRLCDARWEDCGAYYTNKQLTTTLNDTNPSYFSKLSTTMHSVARYVVSCEPEFFSHQPISIKFNFDIAGTAANVGGADVRDIILTNSNGSELGISSKHNNIELKSFRLSPSYDITPILGVPFDDEYKATMQPIWDLLKDNIGTLWSELPNKTYVYETTIKALVSFINKYATQIDINKLNSFIMGYYPYYKLSTSSTTKALKVMVSRVPPHDVLNGPISAKEILGEMLNKFTISIGSETPISYDVRVKNPSTKIQPTLKFSITSRNTDTGITIVCGE